MPSQYLDVRFGSAAANQQFITWTAATGQERTSKTFYETAISQALARED